jgi:Restriction endonuclease fold toxin 9
LQENKFGLGVELEGKEIDAFPIFGELPPIIEPVIARPIVEPVARPLIEPIVRSTVRTATGKPKWDSGISQQENIQNMQKLGRQAHAERQAEWQKEGFKTEVKLDKASRTDGIKIEETSKGDKIGTIRELKPDTKSGYKAGLEQLTRYGEAASKKYPDVGRWNLQLEQYRAISPIDATNNALKTKQIDNSSTD